MQKSIHKEKATKAASNTLTRFKMNCLHSALVLWTYTALVVCRPLQKRAATLSETVGDLMAEQAGIINEGDVPLIGCKELKEDGQTKSGIYRVNLNDGKGEFHVFCDMNLQGGGWTIIQRRVDGTTSFNRSRSQYNVGFGDMDDSNFWLGLEKINRITDLSTHELYIGLESFVIGDPLAWAKYGSFGLGTDTNDYILSFSSYDLDSTANNAFDNHNGEAFSTPDEDNDPSGSRHCADEYSSGWWYENCHDSHLNGIYYADGIQTHPTVTDGIIWDTWLGQTQSLKTVVMAIRPA